MNERWIVIPNWQKFQHYRDRNVPWIKLYTELSHRDEWCRLTLAQRGLLVSIWIEYALKDGQLSSSEVPGRILQKLPRKSLDSLSNAGFIQFSSSKPLALARAGARSREVEVEKETLSREAGNELNKLGFERALTPRERGMNPRALRTNPRAKGTSPRQLLKYTGCRWVRGSHGSSHVYDPLGQDKPPADWPHGRPTKHEVELALEVADR